MVRSVGSSGPGCWPRDDVVTYVSACIPSLSLPSSLVLTGVVDDWLLYLVEMTSVGGVSVARLDSVLDLRYAVLEGGCGLVWHWSDVDGVVCVVDLRSRLVLGVLELVVAVVRSVRSVLVDGDVVSDVGVSDVSSVGDGVLGLLFRLWTIGVECLVACLVSETL